MRPVSAALSNPSPRLTQAECVGPLRFDRPRFQLRDSSSPPPAAPPPTQSTNDSDVPTTEATPTASTAAFARNGVAQHEALLAHRLRSDFETRLAETSQHVADNFEQYSGGDDRLTREDLEKIQNGDVEASAEVRAHADYLLASPTAFNALDVGAGRGEVNNDIRQHDAQGLATMIDSAQIAAPEVHGQINSPSEALEVLNSYGYLADTAGGRGGRNGHIGNDDVQAILQDPHVPEDLQQAAQWLVDNDVSLPGDGSGLLDRATSPFRSAGGWVLDHAGNGADALRHNGGNAARDAAFSVDGASDTEFADLTDLAAERADRRAPLDNAAFGEQLNAHHTNTPAEMTEALQGDYQWLEGDIRRDPPVMGHDWNSNDGMTLPQWLEIGDASGRNLKLDIKEHQSVDGIIEAVQASGIESDRLMFNADVLQGPGGRGPNVTTADLQKLREAFPDARIAIGAKTGGTPEGARYSDDHIEQMVAQAEIVGGPVVFPLREDLVTPAIVEELQQYGDVTIWNDPSKASLPQSDIEARREELKQWGVSGFIDLRAS